MADDESTLTPGPTGGVAARVDRLEAAARAALAAPTYDYVAGGSGTEVSLGEASTAWHDHRLVPHVLRDVSTVDTSVELFGVRLPSPVGVAPFGYQQLLHPEGEVASAGGARGHLYVLSARSDRSVEDVAAVAGPWWFQTYVTADRAIGQAQVERAIAAGAGAVVLTGDTPYVATKARQGRLRPLPPGAEQAPATLDDLARLVASGVPVLVKGVLRADDARQVLDAGAAGVVVSNHGGRQLDRAIAPAHALADVVAAADGAPVLVDGGLRSGHDVLVALALGARAVLAARPFAWAVATGGADAVGGLLDAWTAEFGHVLGLAGCSSVGGVGPDLVRRVHACATRGLPDIG